MFSLPGFSRLSPDALHPDWPLSAAGPEAQCRRLRFRFPSPYAEICFLSSPAIIRRYGSRAVTALVRGLGADSPQRFPCTSLTEFQAALFFIKDYFRSALILLMMRPAASICMIQCLDSGILINPAISLPHQ